MRFLVLLSSLLISLNTFASAELSVNIIDPQKGEVFDPSSTTDFVVAVGNDGPDTAMNLSLRLILPEGAKVVEFPPPQNVRDRGQWSCLALFSEVLCERSSLPPALAPSRIAVKVQLPADRRGGRLPVQAGLTTSTSDPGARPNNDSIEVVLFRLFPVMNNADSGSGSFRQAIEDVNAECGVDLPCKVSFDDAVQDAIRVQSPLPAIERCGVVIDGGPGNLFHALRVEVSGDALEQGNGLELRANCSQDALRAIEVRGLTINGFPENGILISAASDGATAPSNYAHRITGCFIGTDRTGEVARPNGLRGIAVFSELVSVFIVSNILSGNVRSGVFAWSAYRVTLQGNFVGLSLSRKQLPNGASGVFLNTGNLQVTGNLIARNRHFGVAISPTASTAYIAGNSIFGNAGGGIDWGLDGRSAIDADESDGIPNAPELIDAVYDRARDLTVVRGMLRSNGARWGPFYSISLYINTIGGDQGEGEASGGIDFFEEGVFEKMFTVTIPGDLRMANITATTGIAADIGLFGGPPNHTSEFSNAVRPH